MRYRPVDSSTTAQPTVGGRRTRARVSLWLAVVLLAGVGLFGAAGVASAEPTADDWYRLRVCESGNNYAINTGNGYYGAYQFDLGTWRSVGGSGYPHQASPATQDELALKLYRQRGWGPWACARILGLPVRPDVTPPVVRAPIGALDVVQLDGISSAYVAGWAVDPNSPNTSIPVHVYVNNAGYPYNANDSRPDVNAVVGVGGAHGFSELVPLQPGANKVCAFAIGTVGINTLLGCSTVNAPVPTVGYVDNMAVSGWQVTVSGWAFDPNVSGSSIPVHVYVGGSGAPITANQNRQDVNAAFGITGQHGFSVTMGLKPGSNSVCVFAIGVAAGNNTLLQCKDVQGPVPPVGSLDLVSQSGSQAYVAGWALDPNNRGTSIPVHIYVNGVGYARTANKPRDDVNAAFAVSGGHGFAESVPLAQGDNNVCVFGIGVAANNNSLLGCKVVQFNGVQALQRQVAPAPADATAQQPDAAEATQPSTGSSVPPGLGSVPAISAPSAGNDAGSDATPATTPATASVDSDPRATGSTGTELPSQPDSGTAG